MTRSTIRLAQICAAAAAAGLLVAALAQSTTAGLLYADRLVVIVGAAGAVASLGWHGVRFLFMRHEERLRAERRHRVPRPEPLAVRPPSAPAAAPADAADAWPDSYAPDDGWPEQGFARYYMNDETHMHTSSPA